MITKYIPKAGLILLLFASILMMMTQATMAQCVEDFFDPVCDELFVVDNWWEDDGISIDHQYINVTIDDQIAKTHLDMQFSNANSWWVESSYLFPLPENATITNLVLYINGVPTAGEVLDKDEAQAIYDAYVNQNIDPALLKEIADDVFELNVFPIEGNNSRRIEIEYQEILTADQGVVEYTFPQNLSYSSKTIGTQLINVTINSEDEITSANSASHPTEFSITNLEESTALASYEGENVSPDTDFVVAYNIPATNDPINMSLLSHMPEADQNGYFTMLVNPLADYPEEELIPQDVLLVVDTSGSMYGEKIAQAKDAVTKVIETLNENDRFNIIGFSSGINAYSDELVPVTDPGDYGSFINSLQALGGTNISGGFANALGQTDPDRLTTILFLSDGEATAGLEEKSEILADIDARISDNVRIYSFGVGNADYDLLELITDNHAGSTTKILAEDQVTSAVSEFYDTISRPVLTDISIDFGDAPIEQIQPIGPYDLFVGQQLVVTGRYRPSIHDPITKTLHAETEGSVIGTIIGEIGTTLGTSFPITITGNFNGEERQFVYEDQTVVDEAGNELVPVEWAKRVANEYEAQIDAEGETEELKQTITNIGLEYQIITRYTAYLVEEPELLNNGGGDIWDDFDSVPTSITVSEIETHTAPAVKMILFFVLVGTVATICLQREDELSDSFHQ